ncbi:MAG TPA: MFS transporter [Micromonosporaceae bacterium]|jgi:DHA1 family tetracycline resistance protein-like MFS transporter
MRRSLAFLLATVFLDILGLGIIVPIAPSLIIAITGHASSAARWSGVIDSSYGVLQFLSAPLLGRAADRYGRRPVLIASVTLLGVDFLTHSVAGHIWQLVAAHALAGLFAGNGIAVNAYIADVTEPDARARAYGLLGAAFSAGFIAGPAIGGALGAVSVRLPFLVAGCLCLINALFGWLVLPESRPGDRRTALTWRLVNPIGAVAGLLRRPVLGRLAAARMCRDVARQIDQVAWVFFMTARFGWSTLHVGAAMAAGAVLSGVVDVKLTGPAVGRFGARTVAVGCTGLGIVAFTGYAVAPVGWCAYPLIVIDVVAGLAAAALDTLIANATGASEQGTVQGALGGMAALAEAVVPVAALSLLAATLPTAWPGAVFAIAAVALSGSLYALRSNGDNGNRHLRTESS